MWSRPSPESESGTRRAPRRSHRPCFGVALFHASAPSRWLLPLRQRSRAREPRSDSARLRRHHIRARDRRERGTDAGGLAPRAAARRAIRKTRSVVPAALPLVSREARILRASIGARRV